MIRHASYLARHELASAPWRTLVLVLGLAVALFLPAFTVQVGQLAEARLLARAQDTPIVVGHAGNEFDLVMSSLYFQGEVADTIPYAAVERLRGYGEVVPLHVRFTAGGSPLVGTSLAYLDRRDLRVAVGRRPAVLGEVVVGSEVARRANLAPGDRIRSDQTNLYDLSGAYPVLLEVVGVLAPTGGPDDEVLLADVKTTWVIEGLLHGHEEVTSDNAVGGDEDNLEASLALFVFTEIDASTLPSFHLHGEAGDWPLTGVLVFPDSVAHHDQVLGDLAVHATWQAVRPEEVVRTILGIVGRVQELLASWVVLVGISTAAFVGLVLSLVLRLRAPELRLMRRIGAGRGVLAAMLAVQAVVLLVLASGAAAALTVVSVRWVAGSWGLG